MWKDTKGLIHRRHLNQIRQKRNKQKTQQQHIYINLFAILSKGLCQLCLRLCTASLTDQEPSTYAHHRNSRDATSLALQRSSVFKGFASPLSCALYRSFFLTINLNIIAVDISHEVPAPVVSARIFHHRRRINKLFVI